MRDYHYTANHLWQEEFQPAICIISNTNQKFIMIIKGKLCTCLTERVPLITFIDRTCGVGAVRSYRQRHMTPLVSVRHIRTLSVHVSCPSLCIASALAMPEWDDVPALSSFARLGYACQRVQYLTSAHLCTARGLWFLGTQLDSRQKKQSRWIDVGQQRTYWTHGHWTIHGNDWTQKQSRFSVNLCRSGFCLARSRSYLWAIEGPVVNRSYWLVSLFQWLTFVQGIIGKMSKGKSGLKKQCTGYRSRCQSPIKCWFMATQLLEKVEFSWSLLKQQPSLDIM